MTLNLRSDAIPVIHDPHGREAEYRIVYETEVFGFDSPLFISLGDLPPTFHKYRIRIEVVGQPKEDA